MTNEKLSNDLTAPAANEHKTRRWRGIVFGTALFLAGGILGAVVASPGHSFGPQWHGGPGWQHGPMPGGFGFLPGPVEWRMDRVLSSIDASKEQRDKIKPILERVADDLFTLRDKHLEGRKQIRDTLAAGTIDRAKLDQLRGEQMKLAESASKIVTTALADAADVLTPAQRAELAKRIEARRRWFQG